MDRNLVPESDADFQIATDLGRKAGRDVTHAMLKHIALGGSRYQCEVVALASITAALVGAKITLQKGSFKGATDADLVETILEMVGQEPSK